MRGEIRGVHANIIRELSSEEPERFRQCHRESREAFNDILVIVSPLISKKEAHHFALVYFPVTHVFAELLQACCFQFSAHTEENGTRCEKYSTC